MIVLLACAAPCDLTATPASVSLDIDALQVGVALPACAFPVTVEGPPWADVTIREHDVLPLVLVAANGGAAVGDQGEITITSADGVLIVPVSVDGLPE